MAPITFRGVKTDKNKNHYQIQIQNQQSKMKYNPKSIKNCYFLGKRTIFDHIVVPQQVERISKSDVKKTITKQIRIQTIIQTRNQNGKIFF